MEPLSVWLFLSISILVLISPGPNTIYVITQGMTRGRKATFKAVAGASTGDMAQVLAAYLGLAALLENSRGRYLRIDRSAEWSSELSCDRYHKI